jgi:hypothetical protein
VPWPADGTTERACDFAFPECSGLSVVSGQRWVEPSEKGPSRGEERAHTRFGGRKQRYADTALVALDLRRVGIIIGPSANDPTLRLPWG